MCQGNIRPVECVINRYRCLLYVYNHKSIIQLDFNLAFQIGCPIYPNNRSSCFFKLQLLLIYKFSIISGNINLPIYEIEITKMKFNFYSLRLLLIYDKFTVFYQLGIRIIEAFHIEFIFLQNQ